ncbi:MAG: MATE family efflux transporter [Deltaproteobacteria bacterium]|nr:MAG: MATE family efflux transporter [Deltaproteobacteria bacterium]
MVDKEGNQTPERLTKGVKTLLGDPKKAILKLATPMVIAMVVQTMYNLVDALWVSGLGADALAAVGFVYPLFFVAMALATGLGIGGGSAVSRKIGAKDKKGVDNVAVHTYIMTLLITMVLSFVMIVFAENIFSMMGASSIIDEAVAYNRIIFAGSIFLFFSNVSNAILRAEGDAKRAMYAITFGSILNIILDPIFIYVLKLGVAGAAWATVISLCVTSIILFNWLFLKRDTYVSLRFSDFKLDKDIVKDIFKVGLPSSIQQLSMAITMLIVNIVIVKLLLAGTDGVAVYQTGWRIVSIGIMPLLGMATAVVSVTGATFGAREFKKMDAAFTYAVKIGFIVEIFIALATFVLATFIAASFTTAESSKRIFDDLQMFLRIICLFYPGAALGIVSSAMFQGVGKGLNSLIATLIRTVILTVLFVIVFSMIFSMNLVGVWWGIVLANLIGSVIAFIWAKNLIRNLLKGQSTL